MKPDRLRVTLLASVFSLPVSAAENLLEVDLGLGFLDDDTVRLSDAHGLDDDGLHLLGGFTFERRDELDWLKISTADLGLGNRSVEYAQGEWGKYRVRLDYRELEFRQVNDGATIFTNPGSNDLRLPGDWTAGPTANAIPELAAALRPVGFSHERRGIAFDARRLFERWALDAQVKRETRRGTRPVAGVVGNTGGNPRAVFLPMPIHFETRELEASASYVQEDWQTRFGYRASTFDNEHLALRWQNPYSAINGWIPEAGHPDGVGQLAQEPGNQHHQVYFSGAWRATEKLRTTGDIELGRMRQDEPFLPYTVNPAIDITSPLPRSSLQGRIDITRIRLDMHHLTAPRLNLRAGIRYIDHDDRTPRDVFNYLGGDSIDQAPDLANSRARINMPWSYRESRLDLAANWRATNALRVRADARHQEMRRDFGDLEKTDTDTLSINLAGRIATQWQWHGGVTGERRRGSDYRGDFPYLASHTQAYIETVPEDFRFENHPLLRKFHLADRDRIGAHAAISWSGEHGLSVSLSSRFNEDDYDASFFGLNRSRMRAHVLDASWQAHEHIAVHGFLSHEDHDSRMHGRSFRGAIFLADDVNNPARDWWTSLNDRIDTVGLGASGASSEERWQWAADYAWSFGRTRVSTITAAELASEPLPDVTSRLQTLSAHLAYQVNADWRLRLRWQHERAEVRDWAFDDVGPATLANVISLGENSPNYRVNWVTLEASWMLR